MKNIKRFVIACILAFPAFLLSCNSASGQLQGKWISSDSTRVFTFVGDSLYVDCYPSGCGIESYRLEMTSESDCEIAFNGYSIEIENGKETEWKYPIRVTNNPIGNHWERNIKIGWEEEPILIIKIPNDENKKDEEELLMEFAAMSSILF